MFVGCSSYVAVAIPVVFPRPDLQTAHKLGNNVECVDPKLFDGVGCGENTEAALKCLPLSSRSLVHLEKCRQSKLREKKASLLKPSLATLACSPATFCCLRCCRVKLSINIGRTGICF